MPEQPEPDGRTGLPALAEIFHALRRGRHISVADGALYTHLAAHHEAYGALLDDLGFRLKRHPRDFFYLEDSANFTDIAGRMALFVFILIEDLADRGLPVEETLMTASFETGALPHLTGDRYRNLMREAEVTTPEQLGQIVQSLDRYGFIRRKPDDRFGFLSPAYRFLDLCLAYAAEKDQAKAATADASDTGPDAVEEADDD